MLRILLTIAGVVVILVGVYFGIAAYSDSRPPQLFDVNASQNRFTITTSGPHYFIAVSGVDSGTTGVWIGSSPVPLESYLEKEVRLTGEFGFGQGDELACIPGREIECSNNVRSVVFNIESISIISGSSETLTDEESATGTSIPNLQTEEILSDEVVATPQSPEEATTQPEGVGLQVNLVHPEANAYISTGKAEQLFRWHLQGRLAENQSFEIRFYKIGETDYQAPFGWVKENSQLINLNNLIDGGDYTWSVVIVQGVDGNWEQDIFESARQSIKWEG